MYSVVLMMAMTSSADVAVDCWGHNCSGACSGMTSCNGGGLFGGHKSCCGGGLFGGMFGGHSCSGSCHGGGLFSGHSCSGSCHGGGLFGGSCHGGGLFGGHKHGDCHGGACYGSACYGGACYGGAPMAAPGGCWGGTMAPPPPAPMPKPAEQIKPPEAEKKPIGLNVPATATILVSLPADAKLMVDGQATTSTSTERLLETPTLTPGMVYQYTLKAEYMKDGQMTSVTKMVEVRAGVETRVSLTANEIASR